MKLTRTQLAFLKSVRDGKLTFTRKRSATVTMINKLRAMGLIHPYPSYALTAKGHRTVQDEFSRWWEKLSLHQRIASDRKELARLAWKTAQRRVK